MTQNLRLFVNYRRADDPTFVELLRTHFMFRYGRDNVFMDFDSIPAFTRFEEFIKTKVRESDVLVAIIGQRWLEHLREREATGKIDYVRIELNEALRLGKLIAPIVIQGAPLPAEDDVPPDLRPLFALNIPAISGGRDLLNNIGWIMDSFEGELTRRGVQRSAANVEGEATLKEAAETHLGMDDLFDRYADAFRADDYPQALIWLAEIRALGGVPDFFELERRESEMQAALKAQEEARRRREVADYLYKFVRQMKKLGDPPEKLRAALNEVWKVEPAYDPDNIGMLATIADVINTGTEKITPPSKRAAQPAPPPADPVTAALERARAWKGTRNADWTPFIHTFEVHGIAFEMCLVPPGSFMMGSDDKAHPQTIARPYWIARYPTTNAQWRAAVEQSGGAVTVPKWADGYNDQNEATHPVVGVTWHQCQAFVNWLGGEWTLPNEPEWEYAARGVESLVYPWGNDWNGDNAVWSGNSNGSTAPVGSKPGGVSWVGALDLSGNVWEWQRSAYVDYPYMAGDGREDINRTDELYRALRGGSWYDVNIGSFRCDFRYWYYPHLRYSYGGFRLFRS